MDKSEFQEFLDTHKRLGIVFEINWAPQKKDWQRVIGGVGFHVTAFACVVVSVGNTEFLFSNGQAVWTVEGENHTGYGPSGVFLLSRDKKTHAVTARRVFHESRPAGDQFTDFGIAALKKSYPAGPWPARVS